MEQPDFLVREGLSDPAKLRETGLLRGQPGDQRVLLSLAGPARLERLLAKLFARPSSCPRVGCAPCPPTIASIPT